MTHVPLARDLDDKLVKKEKSLYMQQDKWEPAFTLLARTVNENKIVGKADFSRYHAELKPEHKDREFDGKYKQFKFIS